MKLISVIALFLSVRAVIVYAILLSEPGNIKIPLTKRQSTYSKRLYPVPLNDYADSAYYTSVQIGGQSFQVDFDTGSLDIWVPSSTCNSSVCTGHNKFNPAASSTYKPANSTFTIQYVNGDEAVTTIGYDTVSIGNINVTNQVFGAAASISWIEGNVPFDGIMGFGPGPNGQLGGVTFFHQLVAQKLVDLPIFGVYLSRGADPQSEVVLGGVDNSKFNGSFVFKPLISGAETWDISFDDLLIGGNSIQPTNKTATIDTGTSFIIAPYTELQKLSTMINGSIVQVSEGSYIEVPCNFNTTIAFQISGVSFNIEMDDILVQNFSTCVLGFLSIASNTSPVEWILGDAFLKNVYTVYNISGPSVGFASVALSSDDTLPSITDDIPSMTIQPTNTVSQTTLNPVSSASGSMSTLLLKILTVVNICVIILHL